MQVRAAHGLHAVHGAHIARMALHQGRRHEGFADQLLLAVHIAQDAFQQFGALGHTRTQARPGVGVEDQWEEVQRPRTLRAIAVGVDVVGDAVVAHLACQALAASVQIGQALRSEMLEERLPRR